MRFRSAVVIVAFCAASLGFVESASGHPDRDHDKGSAVPNPSDVSDWKGFAPCVQGMAARTFPCDGVDMLSRMSLDDLGMSFVNEVWGWTDPQTRRDYALVGGIEGTAIVDVTMPLHPWLVGTLPSASDDPTFETWRDIKVVNDHMVVVSEHLDHGMQILDLTEVRGIKWWDDPVEFEMTAHYDGIGSAHNVVTNEDSGFVYAVGGWEDDGVTPSCGNGLHMVDLNDPATPSFAGCFEEHGYIHDAQCVIYDGPDGRYQGREICFNAVGPLAAGPDAGHAVSVVDVTDKDNPVALSFEEYPDAGYSHQGWLSDDQRFFFHGDELDEQIFGVGTTTRVWDMQDLEAIDLVLVHEQDTTAIDHNMYVEGDRMFQSNYTAGLRVQDISGVDGAEPVITETGFFDVYPENDDPTFEGGTWSNYPFFRQRNIVAVSSMDRGLFILRPRGSVLH